MNASTLARLDRIADQRRASIHAGVDGARDILTNPLLTREQRELWGIQYMRCVLAQLRSLDDEAWTLTLQAVSA